MSFNGVFERRNRSAKQDAIAMRALANNHDYILNGCAMTFTSTTVTIAPGAMIIGGRIINFDTQSTIAIDSPTANGYGRLKLIIDLSLTESTETLLQAYTEWDYSGTTVFSALTQDDINLSDTDYECELMVVEITSSVATAIERMLETLGEWTQGSDGNLEYVKHASGMIDQWGSIGITSDSSGLIDYTLTLPIDFEVSSAWFGQGYLKTTDWNTAQVFIRQYSASQIRIVVTGGLAADSLYDVRYYCKGY